ncbi:hypothetical protein [Rhodobacteraceae phage LS06-2018-MD07]|jgi:hypothetical protein|nr:hypothetical protein [Rhodobacteraceae phage LS06-2018-MD07]
MKIDGTEYKLEMRRDPRTGHNDFAYRRVLPIPGKAGTDKPRSPLRVYWDSHRSVFKDIAIVVIIFMIMSTLVTVLGSCGSCL